MIVREKMKDKKKQLKSLLRYQGHDGMANILSPLRTVIATGI
jgi:hypothetical protein